MKTRNYLSLTAAALMSVSLITAHTAAAIADGIQVADGTAVCKFKKVLTTNKSDATVPNVTFEFTIEAGNPTAAGGESDLEIKAGVGSPGIGTAQFTGNDQFAENSVSKDVSVDFSGVAFPSEGVYRYKITEKGNKDNSVDGITNDADTVRYLDVYVEKDINKNPKPAFYVLHTATDMPTVDDEGNVSYPGGGTAKSEGFTNQYDVFDLTLTKKVTGNQGDKKKDFTFTVEFVADTIEGAKITAAKSGADGGITETDGKYTVQLKHDETATFKGIPKGAKYTVTESDNAGYTAKIEAEGDDIGDAPDNENFKFTDENDGITGDTDVTFTNNKGGELPMGIFIAAAVPVIVGVAAVGGMAALVAVKRKDRKENRKTE